MMVKEIKEKAKEVAKNVAETLKDMYTPIKKSKD